MKVIAVIWGLDRNDFKMGPGVLCRSLLENGYNQLPIYSNLALAIVTLCLHYMKMLLMSQAIVDGIRLLTADVSVDKHAAAK